MPSTPVLLTGATGFIGRSLRTALEAAGVPLRLCTRRVDKQRARDPDADWVYFDVHDEASLRPALSGCEVAYYLVHSVGASADYPEQERRAANAFLEAAKAEGVRRIIYLGAVAPSGRPSRHLQSRLETGRILRSASEAVSSYELRAAMVIGHGSISWQMVRDLARRLPAMVLPRWLDRRSWPVAIDDVVFGLMSPLMLDSLEPGAYELTGAERISHREMLLRVAARVRNARPVMVGVPVLSPRLSSYWIGWVTSVDLPMARELVEGLTSDLDPSGPVLWSELSQAGVEYSPLGVDDAVRLALADEKAAFGGASAEREERLKRLGQSAWAARRAEPT